MLSLLEKCNCSSVFVFVESNANALCPRFVALQTVVLFTCLVEIVLSVSCLLRIVTSQHLNNCHCDFMLA